MQLNRIVRPMFALSVFLASTTAALAHDECIVAHDGAGNMVLINDFHQPLMLSEKLPGFPGVGGTPLGLVSLFADDGPTLALPASSTIEFVVISTTEGLTMWGDNFDPILPGESLALGSPYFHWHPVWTIEDTHHRHDYIMTGVYRDTTGAFADSPVITLQFAIAPPACPGDMSGDLHVDFTDITAILQGWNNPYTFADITMVLQNFGAHCGGH
ncbi:MAG: hypothetical protein SFZ24_02975 [Planctomycetota bacterium]|nr:hypothetical protein [Planctomycetota bacterium]